MIKNVYNLLSGHYAKKVTRTYESDYKQHKCRPQIILFSVKGKSFEPWYL